MNCQRDACVLKWEGESNGVSENIGMDVAAKDVDYGVAEEVKHITLKGFGCLIRRKLCGESMRARLRGIVLGETLSELYH